MTLRHALLILLCAVPAWAERSLLHAARAVSPDTGKVTSPAWLIIENGRIVSLSATKPAGDTPVTELGEVTLVPGFIDAHAHLLHV